jgi:hypothetical protein
VATSRTIKPAGDQAILTIDGDLSEPATADRIISGALESFGRIDTLIAASRESRLTLSRRASSRRRFIRRESYARLGPQLPPVGHAGQVSDIVDGIPCSVPAQTAILCPPANLLIPSADPLKLSTGSEAVTWLVRPPLWSG